MLRKQKGITLVALVITIIVLLILAGVTISMVIGDNGILNKSRQATFEEMVADAQEKVQLAVANANMTIQADSIDNASYTFDFIKLKKALKEHGINADDDGQDGEDSFKVTEPNSETGAFTITYTDSKFQNASNANPKSNAKIVWNLKMTTSDVSFTDSNAEKGTITGSY